MTDNDIIKRQQAEIEELQGIVNEMGDVFPLVWTVKERLFGARERISAYTKQIENIVLKKVSKTFSDL